MNKKVLGMAVATLLVVGISEVHGASDREARYSMLCYGAHIKHLEKNRQYGTWVKAGSDRLESNSAGYETYKLSRVGFMLALMQVAKHKRSNELMDQLTDDLFPVPGDTIFTVEDKANERENLMARVASSLGVAKVEWREVAFYPTIVGGIEITYKDGRFVSYCDAKEESKWTR